MTPSIAERTDENSIVAAAIVSGIPNRRKVSSQITPRVPSAPTNKCVRSYPADVLRARRDVFTISPVGVTTLSPSTNCFIAPYFTVVVPDAPVDAMPPKLASAPGSTGKNKP